MRFVQYPFLLVYILLSGCEPSVAVPSNASAAGADADPGFPLPYEGFLKNFSADRVYIQPGGYCTFEIGGDLWDTHCANFDKAFGENKDFFSGLIYEAEKLDLRDLSRARVPVLKDISKLVSNFGFPVAFKDGSVGLISIAAKSLMGDPNARPQGGLSYRLFVYLEDPRYCLFKPFEKEAFDRGRSVSKALHRAIVKQMYVELADRCKGSYPSTSFEDNVSKC